MGRLLSADMVETPCNTVVTTIVMQKRNVVTARADRENFILAHSASRIIWCDYTVIPRLQSIRRSANVLDNYELPIRSFYLQVGCRDEWKARAA